MNLAECISVRLEEPNIVLVNNCHQKVYVEYIGVEYYVTSFPAEPEIKERHRAVKRKIEEKIKIREWIEENKPIKLYFGTVSGIEQVSLAAGYSQEDLRLIRITKFS